MRPPQHHIQLPFRGLLLKSFLLFTISFLYSETCLCQSATFAKKGVLDLSKWNWKENGIAELNGDWEFYWNTLYDPSKEELPSGVQPTYINVPGFWNAKVPGAGIFKPAFGYATYKLTIICPPGYERLDLKFLTIASNYKVFVNGKQLLEIGRVGTSEVSAVPAYIPAIISAQPVNNELSLVIQVSNFNYSTGGLWDYIKLGPHEKVQLLLTKNVGIDFLSQEVFF